MTRGHPGEGDGFTHHLWGGAGLLPRLLHLHTLALLHELDNEVLLLLCLDNVDWPAQSPGLGHLGPGVVLVDQVGPRNGVLLCKRLARQSRCRCCRCSSADAKGGEAGQGIVQCLQDTRQVQHVVLAVAAEEVQLRSEGLAQELVLDHDQTRDPHGGPRNLQSQGRHAAVAVRLVLGLYQTCTAGQEISLHDIIAGVS